MSRPVKKPACPNFSSGPTKKRPGFNEFRDPHQVLGRSHRAKVCKDRINSAMQLTLQNLNVPAGYKAGIVSASDTGAVEMCMWSLFGPLPVDCFWHESFGAEWKTDLKQLGVNANFYPEGDSIEYGTLPDFSKYNGDHDCVFTWNGTTSGAKVPNAEWIPDDRKGVVLCDATSAVFAQELPWEKLDIVTFSWQKVLGGEAGFGTVILSPRAIDRIKNGPTPDRPLPKIFRIKKHFSLFDGDVINTISMMALEDYHSALRWVDGLGGAAGTIKRADANLAAVQRFVAANDWVDFLAKDPATVSNTSVCLKLPGTADADIKKITALLEQEKVAYDIGAYRAAPPGIRIWCGATVDTEDVELLLKWLGHAYEMVTAPPQDGPVVPKTPPLSASPPPKVDKFKILIMDKCSPKARQLFERAGHDVDEKAGLKEDELVAIMPDYHALVVRSATKVTAPILEAGANLRIIGRAGVGVDNINVPAATQNATIVVNSPLGNTVSASELTFFMIGAIARNIGQAHKTMRDGKWDRAKFNGVELEGRTLGIFGLGNVGRRVAAMANTAGMKVMAFDPVVAPETARRLNVEPATQDEIYARADFITLHVPVLPSTTKMINTDTIAKMKDGVYIVNVGRGELIDDAAMITALKAGKVKGAALDVFVPEPLPADSEYRNLENVILTPHLGASTVEAQEKVAVDVCEQIIDVLNGLPARAAVNIPSMVPHVLAPFQSSIGCTSKLGRLLAQLSPNQIARLDITLHGSLADPAFALARNLESEPVVTATIQGMYDMITSESVTFVNAPDVAKRNGLEMNLNRTMTTMDPHGASITVASYDGAGKKMIQLSGTNDPAHGDRLIMYKDKAVDTALEGSMIFIENTDVPGMIGKLGSYLGEHGVNISNMVVGRYQKNEAAVMILDVDSAVTPEQCSEINKIMPGCLTAKFATLPSA